ncbi:MULTISPECIES: hypothetical protein [Brevibacillus]|uniref:Uncharacterized protein n=1 Tax=Brevibacillus brevis TaxID=1393 RepID=A0A517I0R5_BREBE|nr:MULTISPECIES: hypothetical protein [Brevibacillus]NRS51964.1 hypothetical protein [Brevibacillus sp. HB2.2]QDS32498.1 hypothetical protein FPS98_00045 [Brevibacillus brevis]
MEIILTSFWEFTEWVANWDADKWAAFGQIMGSIATFWAVFITLRATRRKPRILVRSNVVLVFDEGLKLNATVVNIGDRPVKVESVKFTVKRSLIDVIRRRRPWLIMVHGVAGTLPKLLDPSDSINIGMDIDTVISSIKTILNKPKGKVKIVSYVYDTIGYAHKSKSITVDLEHPFS